MELKESLCTLCPPCLCVKKDKGVTPTYTQKMSKRRNSQKCEKIVSTN